MINRDTLVEFLNQYLNVDEVRVLGSIDGMQIVGRPTVERVVLSTSCSLQLFEQAASWGADMVITHHDLWDGFHTQNVVNRLIKRRLETLFAFDITLLVYDASLDRHPELSHNAQLLKVLGLRRVKEFGCKWAPSSPEELVFGIIGEFEVGIPFPELVERVRHACGIEPPIVLPFGPTEIHRLGITSGGGSCDTPYAIAEGLDAFITGEAEEFMFGLARDGRLNVVTIGHYYSERFGVQAIGNLLAARFGLETKFIDIPCPI